MKNVPVPICCFLLCLTLSAAQFCNVFKRQKFLSGSISSPQVIVALCGTEDCAGSSECSRSVSGRGTTTQAEVMRQWCAASYPDGCICNGAAPGSCGLGRQCWSEPVLAARLCAAGSTCYCWPMTACGENFSCPTGFQCLVLNGQSFCGAVS
jgi:hypothetical protein